MLSASPHDRRRRLQPNADGAAHELGLAQRLELVRPADTIHLASLLVAGDADVVAAADIGEQLRKQVAIIRAIPQVMGFQPSG